MLRDLERLVEPATRGDPESPLRWTCKSTRQLADGADSARAIAVSASVRWRRCCRSWATACRRTARRAKGPAIRIGKPSSSTSIGRCARCAARAAGDLGRYQEEGTGRRLQERGREWQPQGQSGAVRVHDFPDPEWARRFPTASMTSDSNEGWVSVGIDHDTASFAVESIRRWWQHMGQPRYPRRRELLITADGGGSNGSRTRLWKVGVAAPGRRTGLAITVCHFPPGTSKWNKIEHRLFSFISHELARASPWSATGDRQPDRRHHHAAGLRVEAAIDRNTYPAGVKVPDADRAARQSQTGALSWRLELHRGATSRSIAHHRQSYFLTTPKHDSLE